jgi:hypothetical protein
VTYEKPSIQGLTNALDAVQSNMVKAGPHQDIKLQPTATAYEADE